MSWELNIWNADRSTLVQNLTNAATGGLSGGYRWQLTPHGDTVQLEFSGRNDRLRLPPRAVVQLKVDGAPAYWGVLPDPPSGGSPDPETVQVLGGREALRRTLMDGTVYRNAGVYTIARDIFSRLTPPALTYTASQIGDGSGTDPGPELDTYYAPTATLDEVLTALQKAAGVPGGVDAQGRVFLGRPQPAALTVAYAGQPWRRLRVQGRETVTQAVMRVVSAPSGLDNSGLWNVVNGTVTPYLPKTVTVTATHAEHPIYRAQQAQAVPPGVSVLTNVPPTIPAGDGTQNITNSAAAVDGNPDTFASGTGTTWRAQYFLSNSSAVMVLGVRITYTLALDSNATVDMRVRSESALSGVSRNTVVASTPLEASDSPVARTIILPPDARHGAWQAFDIQLRTYGSSTINVRDVVFFTLDEQAALRVAASYLQVPYASPAEITLRSLTPPTPTLTVTGSPDGDLSGSTSLWEYEHTADQLRTTRVRLGSDGQSDISRAIKFAVGR